MCIRDSFNIKQKRWARGFYQLLAALLGFSLVFYPIGYITVLNQTFGYAINQVTYVFNALNFSNGQTFSNAIYYGLLALAFGLVSAFLMSFTKQNSSARRIFRFMEVDLGDDAHHARNSTRLGLCARHAAQSRRDEQRVRAKTKNWKNSCSVKAFTLNI